MQESLDGFGVRRQAERDAALDPVYGNSIGGRNPKRRRRFALPDALQSIWQGNNLKTTVSNRNLTKEFLAYIQVEKGLARNTLESYARDLARLDKWAGKAGKPVQELTRQDLRKWIAQLSREGLAPASVARAVSAARGLFRFLMLDGHIKRHPTEDLDTPQRFAYLPQFLTEDEIDQLFAAPDISTE
ncbi:MAG TPA: site-specific integrase, partial [Pyrinomonadaceae bacterium]|nr:site-specific integrase [Pyrinomonadaceae bacterium]